MKDRYELIAKALHYAQAHIDEDQPKGAVIAQQAALWRLLEAVCGEDADKVQVEVTETLGAGMEIPFAKGGDNESNDSNDSG